MTTITLKDLPAAPPNKTGWPWTEATKPTLDQMPDGSEWPCISIITPSYNQEKYIEATIRSVLLQGYPNLKYVIIDGGSTDGSVEIIKKYERHLSYWISEPDRGQSDAINKGIKKTGSDLVGWINSDDVYTKSAFSKIAKAFLTNPDCILVHGNRILIDGDDNVTGWASLPKFDPTTGVFNVCSETAFWRRSVMDKAGVLKDNLQFAMDLEFFGRLYHYGKFLKLDEYLGCFRCHVENKSSTIAHIGQKEGQREWTKLFDTDLNLSPTKRKSSIFDEFKKIKTLLKHRDLVGLPYLLYRFKHLLETNVRVNS